MNAVKKREAQLENQIRKLKRELDFFQNRSKEMEKEWHRLFLERNWLQEEVEELKFQLEKSAKP